MRKLIPALFMLPLLLFSSVNTLHAADGGYELRVKVKGLSDTICYLANFYGKNQYYKDTAKVDSEGNMVFEGNEELEQGLYTLVVDKSKIIDLLVVEQKFSIETDTSDYLGTLKIKGSEENKAFFEYVGYLNEMQKKAATYQEDLESEDKEKEQQAALALKKLDSTVKAFQKEFVKKHEGKFASKFVYAMLEPEIPEPPKNEDGSIDSTFQYRYYKTHFFDHLDFSDARYLRTPVYHNMISKYIEKLTLQYPDSLTEAIDYVVGKARANYDLFQYTVSWITNTYEQSKIMGMDAIFVHMAENYYLTDEVGWIDSTQKEKIRERYLKMKPLLLGKVAPNIILADTAQKTWYNLHKLQADFTLVYIWSPTCGHCKKVTPPMHDLYLKYKDKGFEVFAVGTEFENEEWIKYIKKHKLSWINVSDSPEFPNNIKDHPNNFRDNYDVYSTPQIYLLDKDKKIIAKKLEAEQLDEFLNRLIEEKEKEEKG